MTGHGKETGSQSLSEKSGFSFPQSGFGSSPSLNLALTSLHLRGKDNHDTFNQFSSSNPLSNPGIGLSVDTGVEALGAPVRAEVGVYKNSYSKPTGYVAATWQPVNLDLPGGLKAEFGGVAGLATGYKGHVDPKIEMGPFVPIVAPRLSVGTEDTKVNATIVPGITSQQASAIAISLSMKF